VSTLVMKWQSLPNDRVCETTEALETLPEVLSWDVAETLQTFVRQHSMDSPACIEDY